MPQRTTYGTRTPFHALRPEETGKWSGVKERCSRGPSSRGSRYDADAAMANRGNLHHSSGDVAEVEGDYGVRMGKVAV